MNTLSTQVHPMVEYLNSCTGSEGLYFDALFGCKIQYTDGVRFARNAGLNWLIVAIMSHLPKFRHEDFVTAEFVKSQDGGGMLRFTDGNDRVLGSQRFDYADAPMDLVFYFENSVLMLNRER